MDQINEKYTKTTSLIELIKKVHEVDGIEVIRLGSIEPNLISEDFIKTVKNLKKMCPHYHISLQSGCDETLKRMNRKYTTLEYKNSIYNLRKEIEMWQYYRCYGWLSRGDSKRVSKTYDFLDEISFSSMHVFKYSPRKGTPAASFEDRFWHLKKKKEAIY